MDQMKFPPLCHRKWAEKRMIEHLLILTKLALAPADDFVHLCDLQADLREQLFYRRPSRPGISRRFPAAGHIPEIYDGPRLRPILPRRLACQRLPGFQHAPKSLHCSGVREIQMLQYFCDAPLPWRMAKHFLSVQPAHHCRNFASQLLQMTVHECYSPLTAFQLKCCRNNKPKPVISGRMP